MGDIREYLSEHIEECRNRIETIQSFMKSNQNADLTDCRKSIAVLQAAIDALKEKQHNDELRQQGRLVSSKDRCRGCESWKGRKDTCQDPPVDGIVEALKEIHESGYEIVVVSTRSATLEGIEAVWDYLSDIGASPYVDNVTTEKPPAIVYIDDRAICFDGHPETLLRKISAFKPWNA